MAKTISIIDEDGIWLTNEADFRFFHPIREIYFEPGVRTQVKLDDWIEGQSVLVLETPAKKAK
jgi:hypothetical protein